MKPNIKKLMKGLLLFVLYVLVSFSTKVLAVDYIEDSSNSLIQWAMETNAENNTYHNITVNGVTYGAHVYTFDEDQEWTTNQVFGDTADCASSASAYAKHMVVVIVRGNLTIASGVTVRPAYNTTYGGPKGFFLFVRGNFVNNGLIDQNHGALAPGQEVYLWRGDNGNYDPYTVPTQGAKGGEKRTCNGTSSGGKAGYDGEGRQTGGGAAAGCWGVSANAASGTGAYGTSYSGGAGSGGGDKGYGANGAANGGRGGNAAGSGGGSRRF